MGTLAHSHYLRRLAKLIFVTEKLFLDHFVSASTASSNIQIISKMKWTIPFFLGMIWGMQLVGQAAIVRERLNLDDGIVDRDIAEDTDRSKRSECKEGEHNWRCTCHGGIWDCPWYAAKDTDRSKRSECRDGSTIYRLPAAWCYCDGGVWFCNH